MTTTLDQQLQALYDVAATRVVSRDALHDRLLTEQADREQNEGRAPAARRIPRRRTELALGIAVLAVVAFAGIAVAASPRLRDTLGIFNEPERPISKDVETSVKSTETLLSLSGAQHERLGDLEPNSQRVALETEINGVFARVVLTRTTTGVVCVDGSFYPMPSGRGGGGGCAPSLGDDDWPAATINVSSSGSRTARRTAIFGATPDGVKQVSIVMPDRTFKATMGTNAYAWVSDETAPDDSQPVSRPMPLRVLVEYEDGRTTSTETFQPLSRG